MKTLLVVLGLLFFWIVGCKSAPKKDLEKSSVALGQDPPPADYVQPEIIQLTHVGENSEAFFSNEGNKIIFKSEKRTDHIQPQIYELDLMTKVEKRITHQYGELSCPYPLGKNRLVYSSTTDEIKEELHILKYTDLPNSNRQDHVPQGDILPPFEIYASHRNGSQIKRLTYSPGYDSEVSVHPNGRSLVFTSARSGDLELYTMNSRGRRLKRITKLKGADGSAFFSPDGKKLVWRHYDPSFQTSQIFISLENGNNKHQLTAHGSLNESPYWHPSQKEIIFSSNRHGNLSRELYSVDVKGLCLKRLTYTNGKESYPTFDKKGEQVLFTSDISGASQIYLMDYAPPKTCLEEIP
jgi:TolB protein